MIKPSQIIEAIESLLCDRVVIGWKWSDYHDYAIAVVKEGCCTVEVKLPMWMVKQEIERLGVDEQTKRSREAELERRSDAVGCEGSISEDSPDTPS